MKEQLNELRERTLKALQKAASLSELENIRVSVFGKKGELTAVLKQMGSLSEEERPAFGRLANEVRSFLEEELKETVRRLEQAELAARLKNEKIDVTMPGERTKLGRLHPLNAVRREIEDIFIGMGFTVAEGPEVELVSYNFDALNTPKNHPARDMQDTFYISPEILLRTQTSPVQAHVMEKTKPPIRIISPGRVYRRDEVDATHSPLFHQIEGLVVDKGITMADLKGTLDVFLKALYGKDTKLRFRPHYFPFTEPSAEVDMTCFACAGAGCRICREEGWIEILGAGMVHPNVLSNCGIDPEIYSGFAFGMGLDRITMLRYGIDDLRLLFENNLKFLNQF